MYVANTHLKPVIGIDIHFVNLPFPFVPLPHPYIGLVIDPFDYIPFIGATVKVNNVPRGNTDTMGMIITFVHIPFGAGFTLMPIIGHDSQNFFGSKRVSVDGAPMSGAGYMLMTCNDIGIPLSFRPGKKFIPIPSLYLPTSYCIPLQWGKPVMVGGPLVPNFSIMALLKAFAFGSFLKILGKAGGKMLKALNNKVAKKFPSTKKLSNRLCKMGFEPVDLITGRVNYEYTDFDLPGPIPIRFTRNWDSDSSIKGPLGHGMHLCYDRCVQLWSEEGCLSVTMADGRQVVFPLLYHGESYYHPQEKITLRRKQNGHFLLDDHDEALYYHFNYEHHAGAWQLSYIENYSGNRIQLHYTGNHLNAITDSAGRLLVFTLDKQSRITAVNVKHRELHQTLVSYTYNEHGDCIEIADALNQVTAIEYRYHLMIKKTDRNGQSFYWEYDSKRRCIHTWGDGGVLEGFIQYRKGHNIVTNSLGENTTYYFDENNLCVQERDHYGNSQYTVYNDNFDVYRQTDEAGNISGYVYDDAGRLKEKILPDGNYFQFHYNQHNQPTLIISPDGNSQTFGYDNQRRLKFINHPNGRTITYDFNEQGQLAAIIESNNRKTILQYDEDENLTSVQLPDKSEANWRYDALGRCIQAVNADGDRRFFEYDELNRIRTIHLPDGNTVKLQYNAYEEVTHATDKHHKVDYEYTPLGNVKKRTINKRELNFFYDTEERLRTIVNETGSHYAFGYNKRGEIISETGFDGMQLRYQRDAIGRIIQVNRPGERFTRYEYDANGRIIRIEYNDGSWKAFTYDKSGRVTIAENENSVVQFERDRSGNVIIEKQQEYDIRSVYDKSGNRTRVTSSLGADIALERNKLGYVTKMHAAAGASWHSQMLYNAAGQELQRILPGDVSVEWKYDQAGRPQEQKVSAKGVVQRFKKYTWDTNNRLSSVLDALSQGSTRFKYDALDNLAFAQYADNSIIHRTTDDAGNIYETKKKTDRSYSTTGALLESEKYIYKYDDEGNLVSKTNKTTHKKTRYAWYANGLLKKVIRPEQTVEFSYDVFHRRIRKLVKNMAEHGKADKGTVTKWVWDGNVPLHEWSYSETDIPKTVVNEWGEITCDREEPNPLNASVNEITWLFDSESLVPCAKIENKRTYSIVCDHLGTPNEAYDADGKKVWECVTDIYGRTRTLKGTKDFIPFRYQGQYEDEETGLYYNRFRYYAPEEGVYISQDPIGLAGNNPTQYAYVNDTNSGIDPYGLSGIGSWNEFLKATKGRFTQANSFAADKNVMKDAASAWKEYKNNFNSTNTPVIGGLDDTGKCIGKPGLNVLESNRWNLNVNDMWIQGGIDRKATFKLVSPQTHPFLWDDIKNRPKVYDRELKQLRSAGYVEIDNHMVHPDNVKKFKAACK